MDCPKCHSDKISSDRACLDCGFQMESPAPVPEPVPAEQEKDKEEEKEKGNPVPSGAIEVDVSGASPAPAAEDHVPQWRKELSQRLKAIKDKKESNRTLAAKAEAKAPSISVPKLQSARPPLPVRPKPVERPPAPKPAPLPPMPIPRQKPLQPVEQTAPEKKPPVKVIDSHEIQQLIDNAVSRQSPPREISGLDAQNLSSMLERFGDQEGKLILLTRTLSGLVDLICVVLCTGAFIIAVDLFSGIIMLDGISLINVSILFLMNYFVYSLFFLIASSQTVGMMITDLRVVGADQKRPTMRQLVLRCLGHLGSLFGLGIGLLISLYNRENLCLHDRLSGTHVVRA